MARQYHAKMVRKLTRKCILKIFNLGPFYEEITLDPVYYIDIQKKIMNKIVSRMVFTLHVSRQ